MSKPTTEQIRAKIYRCKQCGFTKSIQTNHYGQCYSVGNYNACPDCPPFKRPTVWECTEPAPAHMEKPEPWKLVTLGELVKVKGGK